MFSFFRQFSFFWFYVSFITFLGTMSTVAEVDEILSEGESNEVLEMAVKEAKNLFSVTGVCLLPTCARPWKGPRRKKNYRSIWDSAT